MLTWLGVAAAVAALVVVAHWLFHRVDVLGRPQPFPWVSLSLLVVLAAAALSPGIIRAREEHRLGAAASVLAGATSAVHCQTFGSAFVDTGQELGWVGYGADGIPEHATLIKREPCRDLRAYLRSDKRNPNHAQVVAVHVLTHESMHMSGITDESRAECAAVQRDLQTASLLGASPGEARSLAVTYWREDYPRMPDGYRSSQCAAGGGLDEHLASAPWAFAR